MFRFNYRAARGYELVRLIDASFNVQKIEATWLQVQIDNPPEHHNQLTVAGHGRPLTIGKFLTPGERLEVVNALRDALYLRRSTPPASITT